MSPSHGLTAMRIAMVGQKGIPATFGGIEFHVDELARRLVERGHQVSVYVRNWYVPRRVKEYAGIKLIHAPTIKTKHLDAFIHSLTSSCHVSCRPVDIVHYHALGPTIFSWIPRTVAKKVVATLHGLDWERAKWGPFAARFLRFCERTALFIPHKTIVVSKSQKDYFEKKYGKQVMYIPNGVTIPELLAPSEITRRWDISGRDYLLFMGRFTPEKRVDWLIRAFLDTPESERGHLKLVLAGESSGTDHYVSRLRKLGEGRKDMIFTGYVSGILKQELLSNAFGYVLPSDLEGLPIALLEAMSYRIPCLVSSIAPHREVICEGENGYFFDANNYEDFVNKLRLFIRQCGQDTRRAVIENALSTVKTRYNWDSAVDQTLDVYSTVLKQSA
jgi:glycosyltransferase involved in cell wall biosynthesis